jgi:23S rRNA pseudouridine1911/1915/1917 synthase
VILTFPVGAEAGARLDRFLSQAAEGFSRTRLKALIEEGCVRIDGEVAADPARKLGPGVVVTLDAPQAQEAQVAGEDIPLDVVFEDEHLIVVNKPAGLVTHPAPGHPGGTLVNALIRHCGDSLSGIGGVKRPGIVHRLDKNTSGLIVAAKTDAAHKGLADLFADHGRSGSLVREYAALVWNGFRHSSGIVDAAIGRHPHSRERMTVVDEERGRHAVTHWRVEEALEPAALLRCRLETGRTHQIRVHLAHIGHPLLGDSVYGSGFKTKANRLREHAREALAALNRQALHAQTLGFEHPVTSERLYFERPPPEDFLSLIRALRV